MASHKKPPGSGWPWKALAAVAAVLLAVSIAAYHSGDQRSRQGTESSETQSQRRTTAVPPYYANLHGVVLPKTLPPERFREGKTRYAYQVAARIPETLAQLPCYCPCDRVGHKSLLHCYTDDHAAYCDICQDSTLWAEKRVKENAAIATIRQELVKRYSETR